METGDAAAPPSLSRWMELDALSAAAAGRDLMRYLPSKQQRQAETGRNSRDQQKKAAAPANRESGVRLRLLLSGRRDTQGREGRRIEHREQQARWQRDIRITEGRP